MDITFVITTVVKIEWPHNVISMASNVVIQGFMRLLTYFLFGKRKKAML